MNKFSRDFLLGAATAAHQVEGNNVNSDCWALENMVHTSFSEPSGQAVDHYHRYREDIALMARAGLNAYRFSVEWARIEPVEGQFDERKIAHYRDVIRCCRKNGLEPLVTLHHFTSPRWLITKGGWEADTTPADFARYTRYVAQQLGSELNYICTINEANMGLQVAAIAERYKRQMMTKMAAQKSDGTVQVGINLEKMMENQKAAARDAIREAAPHIKVGLTLSLHDIQPLPGGEERAAKEWADEFTHYLPAIREDDFFGVQNYTRSRIDADGIAPAPECAELTQMDHEFYPEALENVIRAVHRDFKGELIVTENGIATADDSRRVEFIRRALTGVQNCIADGIPVKGYCYWSLLDNFEWQKG